MTADRIVLAAPGARLSYLPVAFFSSVMGLSGLAIAARKAEEVLHIETGAPAVVSLAAAVVFVSLLGLYGAKSALHWSAVREEFEHPVRLHFFPTISISIILLSIVALPYSEGIARILFAVGVPMHLAFTLVVLHFWFNRTHFETVHLNPAWFIPIVGNVLVPIGGVSLGLLELSWFFFSIGIVFWLVLFAIITNRVLFHHPLPDRLAPTLFILIAPPAVGFLSYVKLNGELDGTARVLYYFALFMTLFLATQVPRLMSMRFFLSWWAYSFPLAAVTIGSWVMYEKTASPAFLPIAAVLSVVLAAAVSALMVRTLVAVARREICQPE